MHIHVAIANQLFFISFSAAEVTNPQSVVVSRPLLRIVGLSQTHMDHFFFVLCRRSNEPAKHRHEWASFADSRALTNTHAKVMSQTELRAINAMAP